MLELSVGRLCTIGDLIRAQGDVAAKPQQTIMMALTCDQNHRVARNLAAISQHS